jgi:N-acetylmuramoyl-L-alanine amidase
LPIRIYPDNREGSESENMAVVKDSIEDVRTLACCMRAKAEGEGDLGMHMVSNVGVNRIRSGCLDLKDGMV